jgi:hypothetical protein
MQKNNNLKIELHHSLTLVVEFLISLLKATGTIGAGGNKVIYEIHVYDAEDGQAEAVRKRFEDEVIPRMPACGIELLGVFVSTGGDGRLTYVTRFSSEEARNAAWAKFGADPGWLAAKAASEANGPLVAKRTSSVLTPAVVGLLLA